MVSFLFDEDDVMIADLGEIFMELIDDERWESVYSRDEMETVDLLLLLLLLLVLVL